MGLEHFRQDATVLRGAGVSELVCWMRWGDLGGESVLSSMRVAADFIAD